MCIFYNLKLLGFCKNHSIDGSAGCIQVSDSQLTTYINSAQFMPCHFVFINYPRTVRKSLLKCGRAIICSMKYEWPFPMKFARKFFQ